MGAGFARGQERSTEPLRTQIAVLFRTRMAQPISVLPLRALAPQLHYVKANEPQSDGK